MPSKNSVKTYIENGFYHVYNRGVEKRRIFLNEQDYRVFLSYLKTYLSPSEESIHKLETHFGLEKENKTFNIYRPNNIKNYFKKINLVCYVLMPNHFHLVIQQIGKKDIGNFMCSLITKYTMYFNKKYKRVGHLFQGRYKAVTIFGKEYLINLTKYIHLNPLEILNKNEPLMKYPWSSYCLYNQNINSEWLIKDLVMKYFSKGQISYQNFVENKIKDSIDDNSEIKKLFLD